jgi:hypothetical protein
MSSEYDRINSRLFEICWKRRGQFPVPSSCRDYQLYDFYDEMCWQWNHYNNLLEKKREYMDNDEERVILDKLEHYDSLICDIEYEFKRRPWLK